MKKIVLAVSLVLAVSCGGKKPVPAAAREAALPEWLTQGTGAFTGDAGRRLQGVGSASASDPKERRQSADAQAKAQLGQAVEAFSAQLTRLSESTQDNLGDAITNISKKTLDKSAVMDHWVTVDGTEQSVAVLDLDTFKAAVRKVEGDGKLKIEMANNANKAFEALARQ